jgi:hypothetical protein
VIPVVLLKFYFGSCISNREQAFQANGVEGTISISSMREKRRKNEDHHICLSFWGEPPTYSSCTQKDVQFSSRQLCLLRQPSSRTLPVPPEASMEAAWMSFEGQCCDPASRNRLEETLPETIVISMIFTVCVHNLRTATPRSDGLSASKPIR